MYEDVTYDQILSRMLDAVKTATPDLDVAEGSLLYTALAPAAVELQNMYIELDRVLREVFVDTQSRDYLIRRCEERGIVPYPATQAVLKGVFDAPVPVGARFSLGTLNYEVTEALAEGGYKLRCETEGPAGNRQLGTLIPIEYIEGLTEAALVKVLIPGEAEEDTEALRKRYYASLDAQAFGGNIADYKAKVRTIPGVGGVKVYPAWSGGGTVKLVITDALYRAAHDTLVTQVKAAVDPADATGKGKGLAPIGHRVTVESVTARPVAVTLNITYEDGWQFADVKPYIEEALDAYFTELSATWEDATQLVVRVSQIETRLLGLTGIVDLSDTQLDGVAGNCMLLPDEIPKRGAVNG
ncbi:baseplate J/gp47 family protein [Fusibacter sp. JL298sf-3]